MRILGLLLAGRNNIITLQAELELKKKAIAVHLNELQNLGLVEYDNAQSQDKMESKYYVVTEKGKLIYENIVHLLNVLKVPRKKAKKRLLRKI